MNVSGKKLNRTKLDLIVDAAIFLAFLIVAAPQFSGMAVHEWLGVAFGAGILTHLLLHWQWIVGITRKLFGRIQASARINYLLNLALFADMAVLIFSGLAISKIALPALGVQIAESGLWKGLHHTTADAAVMLIGLHVALNWSWVVKTVKKYVTSPIMARIAPRRTVNQPATALKLTASTAVHEERNMNIIKIIGRTLIFLLAAAIVIGGVSALSSAGVLNVSAGEPPDGGFALDSAIQTNMDAVANTDATTSTSTVVLPQTFDRDRANRDSEGFSLSGLVTVVKNLGQMSIIVAGVALATRAIKVVGKRRAIATGTP